MLNRNQMEENDNYKSKNKQSIKKSMKAYTGSLKI